MAKSISSLVFGHVCCREGLWVDVVVAGPAAPLPSSPQLSSTWRCYSGLAKMGFICFRSNKIPDAYLMLWRQDKNIQKFLSSVHSLGQSWSLYSDTAALCKSWLYHWTLPEDSFFTFSCVFSVFKMVCVSRRQIFHSVLNSNDLSKTMKLLNQ